MASNLYKIVSNDGDVWLVTQPLVGTVIQRLIDWSAVEEDTKLWNTFEVYHAHHPNPSERESSPEDWETVKE